MPLTKEQQQLLLDEADEVANDNSFETEQQLNQQDKDVMHVVGASNSSVMDTRADQQRYLEQQEDKFALSKIDKDSESLDNSQQQQGQVLARNERSVNQDKGILSNNDDDDDNINRISSNCSNGNSSSNTSDHTKRSGSAGGKKVVRVPSVNIKIKEDNNSQLDTSTNCTTIDKNTEIDRKNMLLLLENYDIDREVMLRELKEPIVVSIIDSDEGSNTVIDELYKMAGQDDEDEDMDRVEKGKFSIINDNDNDDMTDAQVDTELARLDLEQRKQGIQTEDSTAVTTAHVSNEQMIEEIYNKWGIRKINKETENIFLTAPNNDIEDIQHRIEEANNVTLELQLKEEEEEQENNENQPADHNDEDDNMHNVLTQKQRDTLLQYVEARLEKALGIQSKTGRDSWMTSAQSSTDPIHSLIPLHVRSELDSLDQKLTGLRKQNHTDSAAVLKKQQQDSRVRHNQLARQAEGLRINQLRASEIQHNFFLKNDNILDQDLKFKYKLLSNSNVSRHERATSELEHNELVSALETPRIEENMLQILKDASSYYNLDSNADLNSALLDPVLADLCNKVELTQVRRGIDVPESIQDGTPLIVAEQALSKQFPNQVVVDDSLTIDLTQRANKVIIPDLTAPVKSTSETNTLTPEILKADLHELNLDRDLLQSTREKLKLLGVADNDDDEDEQQAEQFKSLRFQVRDQISSIKVKDLDQLQANLSTMANTAKTKTTLWGSRLREEDRAQLAYQVLLESNRDMKQLGLAVDLQNVISQTISREDTFMDDETDVVLPPIHGRVQQKTKASKAKEKDKPLDSSALQKQLEDEFCIPSEEESDGDDELMKKLIVMKGNLHK